MSWFVYVIWVSGDELSMDEPATERKSPERQFVVRDHVMRRLQEPTQRRRGSRFPAIGLGDGGQGARRCHPYFTSSHLQPFYRAEFGFEEGNFPATEFPEFAQFAEPAGRTSIAVLLHDRLSAPHRRGDRLRRRRPRAGAGGGAVGSASTPSRHELLPPESPGSGHRSAQRPGAGRPGSVVQYITCRTLPVVLVGVRFSLPSGARLFSFVTRRPRQLKQPRLAEDLTDFHAFEWGE